MLEAKLRPPPSSGVVRDRLERRLDDLEQAGIGLVSAPAGAGKTTLMARACDRFDGATGWIRLDHSDGDEARLLAGLSRAAGLTDSSSDLDSLLLSVENHNESRLLVIDDLHTIHQSPSSVLIDRLLLDRPANLTLLLGSRPEGAPDGTRLRVSGALIVIDADELRFRQWETEDLYRNHFDDRLPPEDIARLNQLTGGWAVGLHLFHIATVHTALPQRRSMLDGLRGRTRLTDEYLTGNILAALPDKLASFFLECSILATMNVSVCNQFLGRDDSLPALLDLERRGLVTRLDDGTTFSCHEILRSHLESHLVASRPEAELVSDFTRAARVLEGSGFAADALRAYARAGDARAAAMVLRNNGEALADEPPPFDTLPASLRSDPWLLLAEARKLVADGDLGRAIETHHLVAATTGRPAQLASTELNDLRAWNDRTTSFPPSPSGRLRQATITRPRVAAHILEQQGTAGDLIGAVTASLLAGDHRGADRQVDALLRERTLSSEDAIRIQALEVLSSVIGSGTTNVEELGRVADLAEKTGLTQIGRLVRAVEALSGNPAAIERAHGIVERSQQSGDRWGAALAHLAIDFGVLRSGRSSLWLGDGSGPRFVELGAPVLGIWAQAVRILARSQPTADELRDLEARARDLEVPGVRVLTLRALATLDRRASEQLPPLIRELGLEGWPEANQPASSATTATVDITCFGDFAVRSAQRSLPLGDLKPRPRELLRLLAALGGRPLPADRIGQFLWPEIDPDRMRRNLQVAVSAIRTWFSANGIENAIQHDAGSYVLNTEVASTDVARLHVAVAAASTAEGEAVVDAHAAVLRIAGQPLLDTDQATEWWAELTGPLIEAITSSAEAVGRTDGTNQHRISPVDACRTGLLHAPYRDELWRLHIELLRERGDRAEAAAVERRYAHLLAELGID